ncbi:small conductance mechanosensitive channel [Rhodobacter sp. JA431]|uniref:mechanosensitive ion channel domain-containing protein n=1 Tax=Rhodobacter sp. JA431 TaxID=570013 RepID=UPI000BD020E2|nr:mechanosensitive ion channel domain-containing protein [Rhodobacter sp. JA431]SOC03977.1 small conductance mechanosensitive channel [Rhodobacter sp. JA431]
MKTLRTLPALSSLALIVTLALPTLAQNTVEPAAPTQSTEVEAAASSDKTTESAATPTTQEVATPAVEEAPVTSAPLASQALDIGTGFGHDLAATLREQMAALARELSRISSADSLSELTSRIWNGLAGAELASLFASIVVTVGTSLALSALFARWRKRPIAQRGTLAKVQGTLVATLFRLVNLGVAWAVGLTVASWLSALTGQLFILQTLYLSAFALFGLSRIVLALVASPEAESGRSLSWVAPPLQRAIYQSAVVPIGITVQGMMFVAPGLREIAGLAVLRPTRVLVATLALMAALWGIQRVVKAACAHRATDLRPDPAAPATPDLSRSAAALLTRSPGLWAWPARVAALYAWLVTITMPALAGQIVLAGLGGTVVALILVAAALELWDRSGLSAMMAAQNGAFQTLPETPPATTPLLQALGAIASAGLMTFAVVALLAGWGVIDLFALVSSAAVKGAFWRVASAFLVLAGATALWFAVSNLFDRWLMAALPGRREYNRRRTLLRLFRNAFGLAVVIISVMLALSQLGLDVAPLLAGAGVVGIAVGFGAQKLVQDIITGIFIQIENAVNEGDVVEVAGLSGGVERVSIRSIRLRALDGTLHIVPFSSVTTVSNMTRDFSAHVAEFAIAAEEDVAAVHDSLQEAFAQLKASDLGADLRGDVDLQGIVGMSDGFYTYRALLRTAPAAQWAVGRRFTQLARASLAARGIASPPAPRRMLLGNTATSAE